ncbi:MULTISPECIES: SGNH/GDSL hydrolase family protein [unclassified Pseudoxanthomonas]|uniref:SGNH/GDSL hydrolase family protein n=1 Tax=unclassified Pseudoxanthomonas TaxID=2645906 RepID=UPI0008E80418|nr:MULTISPECIES: SGNH/GDSL hydrolase family protein [unclassified Pseudoxanthomonas]PPJ41168.1 SGNH/GDSL hydrolase family protein [Pseudoxanthomonas sp. KAs_5_3]SFV31061.1 Lysophospholipase L1 [Pseudoxanthomonas sp. YR558]
MTTTSGSHTTALTTELRYLALGDSYTIGEAVDEAGRWPMQLARLLRMEGVLVGDPRIIATTGWTTDELDAAITAAEPLGQHDFVTLLIGVNNQYRGRDVEEYRTQFAALLWRAIGFAGGRPDRVLVLSIPDWGVTPFGAQSGRDIEQIARELDAYNTAARTVCAQRDVAFVDITPVSRARGSEATMVADDGLHPSAAMYTEWTRLAFPVAHHLLAGR